MKKPLLLLLLLVTAALMIGCAHRVPPERQRFADEVIRTLGEDGKACSSLDGQSSCIVKASDPGKPIVAGDILRPGDKLLICARSGDQLSDCKEPTVEFECNEIIGCGCSGLDDCIALANSGQCDGHDGHCGDCPASDCCCQVPNP